jgi:hypothetical protein
MSGPLELTDQQFDLVKRASELLPLSRRNNFLRSIASRLDDIRRPTDVEVEAAVSFLLSIGGVSADHSILNCKR